MKYGKLFGKLSKCGSVYFVALVESPEWQASVTFSTVVKMAIKSRRYTAKEYFCVLKGTVVCTVKGENFWAWWNFSIVRVELSFL